MSEDERCVVCGVRDGYGHKPGCQLVEERLGDLLRAEIEAACGSSPASSSTSAPSSSSPARSSSKPDSGSSTKSIVGKRYPLSAEAVARIDARREAQRRVFESARAWDKTIDWPATERSPHGDEEWDLHDALTAHDALVSPGTSEEKDR
jgi:hypothetical protein